MAKMFPIQFPDCSIPSCKSKARCTISEEDGSRAEDYCIRHGVKEWRARSAAEGNGSVKSTTKKIQDTKEARTESASRG